MASSVAAFNARDLGADQRGAVFEVLRAILRPDLKLSVVGGQSLEMLLPARQREQSRSRRPAPSAP